MAEKFIECWYPGVEGTALFAESSLSYQISKGWAPVLPDPAEELEPEPKPKPKPKVKKAESPEE